MSSDHLLSGIPPDIIGKINSSGLKTIGFGDSIIDRNFLETATEKSLNNYGYINIVNMILGSPFDVVYDGGVVGDTTTQMLARISDALAYEPRVVFINAGTNDIYGDGASAVDIIPRLKKIFDAFLITGADVHYNLQAPRTFTATAAVASAVVKIGRVSVRKIVD